MVTTALPVIPYIGPVSPYLSEGLKARGSIVQRANTETPTDMPANAAAVQKIITYLHAGLNIAAT